LTELQADGQTSTNNNFFGLTASLRNGFLPDREKEKFREKVFKGAI
jgi:hypothetical protein